MPRIRQNGDKYATEDFLREVESKRGWYGLKTNEALGNAAGIKTGTMRNRLLDPETLTVGELRRLIRALRLDIWVVLRFIGYETKEVNRIQKIEEEATA